MIAGAHDGQRLGREQFAVEIARPVVIVAQADRRLAAADKIADLGAGRRAQRQIHSGICLREALHDLRKPAAGERADDRKRDWSGVRLRQRANRVLRILRGGNGALRIGHHHPACIAQHGAPGAALEQRHAEFLLEQRDAARNRRLRTVQGSRRVGNSALAMHGQKGFEGVAVHIHLMQKTDAIGKNNKFG